ncbi:MAG: flagellar export chaperone FliS [Piscinibacter sp.]|uniref:flagellar export chaperone FliS n=1 Tax=Piscinibacter sp. TaxID=1903157 RepID=UPI0011DAF9F5|nr:flagellar export chaperone FliS [Piscinibacter sp.]MBP5991049.1 flagellar export chaperone FliS [Piscinibacter sp.]MBP6028141.1 flagellar export chaperone FliS [Piscinibacter sp.]TXH46634.1 MAG: flagellar export chaperone FliS [Burkholderiaceae bacterium]
MFAATNASPRALHSLANAYQQIGLETATTNATPHKLIELLFEGFADAVARARGALLGRQIEAKGRAIGHAARIVEEGLKAGLNQKDGGRIAADLDALYAYIGVRLTYANLHNDLDALDECARLMEPVRSAWAAIGPQVTAKAQ